MLALVRETYNTMQKNRKAIQDKSAVDNLLLRKAEIVSLFKKELGLDTVLMGFGLDSDAIHSPNEHYGVKNFLMGIETIVSFYKHFSKI